MVYVSINQLIKCILGYLDVLLGCIDLSICGFMVGSNAFPVGVVPMTVVANGTSILSTVNGELTDINFC